MVWPTSVIASIILWTAQTPSSLSFSLESYISIGSCVVTPSPITTLTCLLKISLHNLSNSGLIVSSIPSTHLTTSLNFFVNHVPSSHSNQYWCQRWIFFQWHNVVNWSASQPFQLHLEFPLSYKNFYYIMFFFNSLQSLTLSNLLYFCLSYKSL